MINWIRKVFGWLFSRPTTADLMDFDFFKPSERLIYKYWNGKEVVAADPLVLYKRMMDRGPEIAIDIKVSESQSKAAGKAHNDLLQKIREIFNVETLENGGLTEIETTQLLDHFMMFSEQVKKNSSVSPTSSNSSEETSEFSDSKENPRTPSSSDSGSIDNASTITEPAPSPSESV